MQAAGDREEAQGADSALRPSEVKAFGGDATTSKKRLSAYSSETPSSARAAVYATLLLSIVGLGSFAVLVVLVSLERHISRLQAIFGPLPGVPLVTLLYYVVPTIALQGAVALLLRLRPPGLRVADTAGAFVIAAFCFVWFAAVIVDLVR